MAAIHPVWSMYQKPTMPEKVAFRRTFQNHKKAEELGAATRRCQGVSKTG